MSNLLSPVSVVVGSKTKKVKKNGGLEFARKVWQRWIHFWETSFEIRERRTTLSLEILCGFLHFVSTMYTMPVIPIQLEAAGYNKANSIQITALGSAVGCIAASYITNLPFVVAPPASVAIYIAVALQETGMNQSQGDAAVILSGFALLFIGVFKPLIAFVTKLIPDCIQASTAIGFGLITALAGALELKLVVPGKYAILQMGEITPEIIIAMFAVVVIAVMLYNKVKGAYTAGLIFGTIVWWTYAQEWPHELTRTPHFIADMNLIIDGKVIMLLLNLIFLYILTLSGIARSMADVAGITLANGTVPRGNWLFIMCGVSTIFSGYFSGPPILVSPESAPGIKSGARTGLSMLVCGVFYSISVFFCPVLERVPPAGTSPLLILVGLTLFVNANRIYWHAPEEAIPAFFVLLLIPFTYSILTGVGVGYVFYVLIGVFTCSLHGKFKKAFLSYYTTPDEPNTDVYFLSGMREDGSEELDEEDGCGCEGEGGAVTRTPTPGEVVASPVMEHIYRSPSFVGSPNPYRPRQGSVVDHLNMNMQNSINPIHIDLHHAVLSGESTKN